MLQLLSGPAAGTWTGSRLDTNLDGKIDAPAAAIMDAWWPRLAVVVLQPVLGPLTDQLKTLAPISDDANPGGSSYDAGWYGYDYAGHRVWRSVFGTTTVQTHYVFDEAGHLLAEHDGATGAVVAESQSRERCQ